MTEEEKKIKKWSNEQKVEALAKFVALRSGDPRKALLYGFMLDCLLDEIDKRERKIKKQQSELEKKDIEIKRLETQKQELIEKLEEAIDFAKIGSCPTNLAKAECLENVLKILKGEKE